MHLWILEQAILVGFCGMVVLIRLWCNEWAPGLSGRSSHVWAWSSGSMRVLYHRELWACLLSHGYSQEPECSGMAFAAVPR